MDYVEVRIQMERYFETWLNDVHENEFEEFDKETT